MTELKIELVTEDGFKTKIKRKKAEISGLLKDMLEEEGEEMVDDDEDEEDEPITIPIPNIKSRKTLDYIIKYMTIYNRNTEESTREIEIPLRSKDIRDVLYEGYHWIIHLSTTQITNVINGANYLSMPHLLNITGAIIAADVLKKAKGNDHYDKIKKMFGVEPIKDMSEKNYAILIKQNGWD